MELGEIFFQVSRGKQHRRNLGNSFSKCSEANDTDETWGTLFPSVPRLIQLTHASTIWAAMMLIFDSSEKSTNSKENNQYVPRTKTKHLYIEVAAIDRRNASHKERDKKE
ncbi:unnamed protein product [Ectocarpus sp. 13 AM-2016]